MSKTAKPHFEKIDWRTFEPGPVIGVDEVGRGCLAGPVYAAAVCLKSDEHVEGLTDSKLISESRREKLSPLIKTAHWVSIASASVEEIDELNILQASLLAMKRAVEELEQQMGQRAGHIVVDGNFRIPDLPRKQTPLVKGDLRCAPISAASIVAKVARDHLMKEFGEIYPGYALEAHKGYASPTHRQAIQSLGPTPIHRKSFSGVKEYLPGWKES